MLSNAISVDNLIISVISFMKMFTAGLLWDDCGDKLLFLIDKLHLKSPFSLSAMAVHHHSKFRVSSKHLQWKVHMYVCIHRQEY